MLFVAEYDFCWDMLETVIAKRLEWEGEKPEDFRFIGEYIWQDREPPFRGVVIVEAGSVDALNAFALHYGPSLQVRVHPASDVMAALRGFAGAPRPRSRAKGKGSPGSSAARRGARRR